MSFAQLVLRNAKIIEHLKELLKKRRSFLKYSVNRRTIQYIVLMKLYI